MLPLSYGCICEVAKYENKEAFLSAQLISYLYLDWYPAVAVTILF